MRIYNTSWKKRNSENQSEIALNSGLSLPVLKVLAARGITAEKDVLDFINPSLLDMHDPFLLSGMKNAVYRIKTALSRNEKIGVFGDYDVDGITSSALLHRFFLDNGVDVKVILPNRYEHGYGLNPASLELVSDIDLLITVDCGITSVGETELLKEQGVDVIVTDHHTPKEVLPDAAAVVNPTLEEYPFRSLAGVGTAYKLADAVSKELDFELHDDLLAYAAVGTIADMMPLKGENRIISKLGLEKLKTVRSKGLKELVNHVSKAGRVLTAGDIGFKLAPVLNAQGRLESPDKAFRLFISEDETEIKSILSGLLEINERRKAEEATITKSAISRVKDEDFIVLFDEKWSKGVIGLSASRVVEEHRRPVILLNRDGNILKGSGRSIGGYNILEALEANKELLVRFGGHSAACGLELEISNLEALKSGLSRHARDNIRPEDVTRLLSYEMELSAKDLTHRIFDEMTMLEPFGIGNPAPKFRIDSLRLMGKRVLGAKSNVLKTTLSLGERVFEGITFGDVSKFQLSNGNEYDIVTSLDINHFNGIEYHVLGIKDFRMHSGADIEKSDFHDKYLLNLAESIGSYGKSSEKEAILLPDAYFEFYTGGSDPDSLIAKTNFRHDGVMIFPNSMPKISDELFRQNDSTEFESKIMSNLPDREDLVRFYKLLSSSEGRIDLKNPMLGIEKLKVILCLNILKEINVVKFTYGDSLVEYEMLPVKGKMNLDDSKTYNGCSTLREDYNGFKTKDKSNK